MHHKRRALIAALLLAIPGAAAAQLPPVGPLTVSTAMAGSQPNPASASVTFASGLVFTGQRRVMASLNANTPVNTTLAVRVTGGPGGTSLGFVNLSTTPRDVVVAAQQSFFAVNTLSYTFSALVTAGVIGLTNRTVTFTVAAWP